MTSSEIRRVFLEFFQERGHAVVPSSPLVPHGDPTLLFTNAGMNQFKNVFLGNDLRDYSRAASSQKCVRAGGKHNDLENVGRTRRHHTFFEMLGNFSFGDYFKEEAIAFSWELLTQVYGLDPDKLWITVFREDDEAETLWKKVAGLPSSRIERMDEADNFWSMGDTGPCGPCSEIHYDFGPGAGTGSSPADPASDGDRFVEIWNLVFMQYDRSADGVMTPLPRPSIDTGMGLERITLAMQGVLSTWETDLFTPILSSIGDLTGRPYSQDTEEGFYFRVIADHLRSATFLIGDNVFPSNEFRGYVLRRILRRAISHGYFLGVREPCFYQLVDTITSEMASAYPELSDRSDHVRRIVQAEEESFCRVLEKGIDNLEQSLDQTEEKRLDGAAAFRLSDTDGLPVDVIQEIAEKRGVEVDMEGFEGLLEEQRCRSRSAARQSQVTMESYTWEEVGAGDGASFLGYETLESTSSLVRWRRHDNGKTWVVLDRSPFYAESGGQVGDTGTLSADGWEMSVEDTFAIEAMIVHSGTTKGGDPSPGTVVARVDGSRRADIQRNHTATHLLHALLRSNLGEHVHQAGSLVAPDRLRFDFTHYAPLEPDELASIEDALNRLVLASLDVSHTTSSYDDALEGGAMALFGEKYGDEVRVLRIGDGVSTELCGGTHCSTTGEIGPFVLVSESGIAAGVRRVEALTGQLALDHLRRSRDVVQASSSLLKVLPADLLSKVEDLSTQNRQLRKELEGLQVQLASDSSGSSLEESQWGGLSFVTGVVTGISSVNALRELADKKRRTLSGSLGAIVDNKPIVVSFASDDGVSKGLNAGTIAKELGRSMGGGGGGKPHMAQSGGKNATQLEEALQSARDQWKAAAE